MEILKELVQKQRLEWQKLESWPNQHNQMGGLSYLSKKSWHPSTFKNIQMVWTAEQKQKQDDLKYTQHLKKLKEEHQIEQLIQLQNKATTVTSYKGIDWMYQVKSAHYNNCTGPSAEEYLLGIKVEDIKDKLDQESKFEKNNVPVTNGDQYKTSQNQGFLKMMEDPLVLIKSKELEARNQVYDNSREMKQTMNQIEALKNSINNKNKSKQYHKKDKKDKKKQKDKKRHQSVLTILNKIKVTIKAIKHRNKERFQGNTIKQEIKTGIITETTKSKQDLERKKTLGPDMKIYGEKARLQEQKDKLRKKQEPTYSINRLTPEEVGRKIHEMIEYGQKDKEEKIDKLEQKGQENSNVFQFLQNQNQIAQMGSGLSLENRVGRNKHYLSRDALRE
eukprot:403341031